MKLKLLVVLVATFNCHFAQSQEYWGAGNADSIAVISSSSFSPNGWTRSATPDKTINGDGLDARTYEVSRFMSQATMGVPPEEIQRVRDMSFEQWMDEQFEAEGTTLTDHLEEVWEEVIDWNVSVNGRDSSEFYEPSWLQFNYAWWSSVMLAEDYLRRKVTQALSEILVVSINSNLSGRGWALSGYHDVLYQNAFGNYRDLLGDVTLHPSMGHYLSHLNNPRTDTINNIRPDENYAREIMQLFTIGLYELNQNGERRTDVDGAFIPTYDQDDIREFAKIFTGLGFSEVRAISGLDSARFDHPIYFGDFRHPMKMYENYHEPGQKHLLNGTVVPAGNSGMEDIEAALDNLFDHPNVGPFLGKLLIQRLVKSNPTPAYVGRVAAAFNDNGRGVRGDLKAVVKAILLDPEARECAGLSDPDAARLRPPLYRITHFARSVMPEQAYGRYWNTGYQWYLNTGMSPFWSPTVFNFYLPDFQPQGELSQQGLVAPEFQLHNTKQSIGFINEANYKVIYNSLFGSWEAGDPGTSANVDHLKEFANDPEVLVNELDKLYTHGEMTDRTREIIKEALDIVIYGRFLEDRVRLGIYLVLMSPDYAIIR